MHKHTWHVRHVNAERVWCGGRAPRAAHAGCSLYVRMANGYVTGGVSPRFRRAVAICMFGAMFV
jgi:hypothetical protein